MEKQIEGLVQRMLDKYVINGHSVDDFVDVVLSFLALEVYVRSTRDTEQQYFWDSLSRLRSSNNWQAWSHALKSIDENTGGEIFSLKDNDLCKFTFDHIHDFKTCWRDIVKRRSAVGRVASASVLIDAVENILATEYGNSYYVTPKELVNVMVGFADQETQCIYDPNAGTGGLLAAAMKHLHNAKTVDGFCSNKLFRKVTNLRLSLINRRFQNHVLENKPIGENRSSCYDFIITNPPFGNSDSAGGELYFFSVWRDIAEKTKRSDTWYVCHSLSKMSDKGKAMIILPSIYLSGTGVIRELISRILEQNILEAVVELPGGIFAQTGVATSLFYFNKNRSGNDNIILIDAKKAVKRKGSEIVLDDERIIKLLQTARKQSEIDANVTVVSPGEIISKNYCMQQSKYVASRIGPTQRRPSSEVRAECEKLESMLISIRKGRLERELKAMW